MPKIQKLRKHKVDAAPYTTKSGKPAGPSIAAQDRIPTSTSTDQRDGKPLLSRGQKKRQQRKDRILNVKVMIENSTSKSAKKQPAATFIFSDLEKSLPRNDDVIRPSAAAPRSNKMKGKVAVREVERMKLIQEHPSFKQDPLAAIKYHIEHMVAVRTGDQQ